MKYLLILVALFMSYFIVSQEGSDVEELVVSGIFIPDEKRSTSEISNILDTTQMSEAGDSNIADSLKRVTGLSLFKGKYVYVRGLGDRYSTALLDGSSIASPEPLSRVVPLDLFPTSILESVLVQKTFSPEFPGNFGGGVINLRTIAVPDEEFVDFSFSLSGDSLTTGNDFYTTEGHSSDFFGFGLNNRELPAELRSVINSGKKLRRANQFYSDGLTPDQLAVVGKSLEIPSKYSLNSLDPNFSVSVSAGNSYDIRQSNMGIIFALNFSNKWDSTESERYKYAWQPEESDPNLVLSLRDSEEFFDSMNTIRLSSLFGLGFEIDDDNTVKLTSFLTRKSSDKTSLNYSDLALSNFPIDRWRIEWVERQVWTNQASGEHFFGDLQFNWRASYSEGTRDAPYSLDYQYEIYNDGRRVLPINRSDKWRMSFFDLTDEIVEIGADFLYFIATDTVNFDIKAGFSYYDKERDNKILRYEFNPSPTAASGFFTTDFLAQTPSLIFAQENISPSGWELNEITTPADFYIAESTIGAAYLGFDMEISDTSRLALGVRYEDSDIDVSNYDRYNNTEYGSSDLDLGKAMPALTWTETLEDNQQIRMGLSQTVVRPNFRELALSVFFNPQNNRAYVGNSDLQITEIDNFDFRYENYFGDGGQYFSAGFFYKQLKNPIETVIESGTFYRKFRNVDDGTMTGVEFEVYYDFFPFYLRSNLTFMNSEVDLPSEFVKGTRSLQGQSDFLGNITFGYDSGDHKVVLAYNYTGERISELGAVEGAPVYMEQGSGILDLNYTAYLLPENSDNEIEIGFTIGNVTGEDYEVLQLERIQEKYDLPTTYSFGVKVNF